MWSDTSHNISDEKENDALRLEDKINKFEKELEGQGMQIRNVALSAAIDYVKDYALYSIVSLWF